MVRVDYSVSAETDAMISVRDRRVNYGEREILHGIDVDIPRGETLVILGGSGSEKITLLRTLVGLEKPSAGEIWIKVPNFTKASDVELYDFHINKGMSFQVLTLLLHKTV